MNQNESWIAEQARLLMLEDGFGPGYTTATGTSAAAITSEEAEAASPRSSSA
jgi:hypothetical protein